MRRRRPLHSRRGGAFVVDPGLAGSVPVPVESDGTAEASANGVFSAGGLISAVTALTSLFNMLVLAAISRDLGVEAVGVVGVGLTIGTYLFVLGTFGTTQLLIQEIARNEKDGGIDFRVLLAARAVFIVVSATIVLVLVEPSLALATLNVVATLLLDLAMAVYYGFRRAGVASAWLFVYRGAGLIAVPVVLWSHSLTAACGALVAASLLAAVPALWHADVMLRGSRAPSSLKDALPQRLLSLAKRGTPLAAWAALDASINRADVAVLGLTAGARDAGQYVAGSAIAVGIGAICIGISYALLPALSQQNESEARETLRRVLRVLIPMCTVVSCVLVLLARDAIGLVYGFAEDQTETVAVFRILILGLPFLVAGRCLQIGLVALGNNVLVLWTQALGAAVSVLAVTVGYFVSGVRGVAVGAVGAYVAIAIAGWVGFVRASDVRQATESV